MKTLFTYVLLAFGGWSLSGCSTPPAVIKGVKHPECVGTATVQDRVDSRKYLLEMFGVAAIDGEPLVYSIQSDEGPGRVWCGSHELTLVYLGYRNGKSYAPVEAHGTVTVALAPGSHYVVRGELLGDAVQLWLEEENGTRLGQVTGSLVPRNDSSLIGFPLLH